MLLVYLVFITACISTTKAILKAIKEKNTKGLLVSILPFPFFFCFFVGILSGGSAFHDAVNDYEFYQSGHYYLVSHGTWTEVSYKRYLFVLISEIIGFSSLALSFVLALIRDRKQEKRKYSVR